MNHKQRLSLTAICCFFSLNTAALHAVELDEALETLHKGMGAAAEGTKSASENPECCTGAAQPHDLLGEVGKIRAVFQGDRLNRRNCGPYLRNVHSTALKATPSQFDPSALKKTAAAIIDEIFSAKLDLRAALARMEKEGPLPGDCVDAARDVFRASLFLSEYLAEHFISGIGKDRVFEGSGPELLLNPKFGPKLELRSGDVLLSRGDAFASGAISRIGDTDGNFSHIAVVYIDAETKEVFTVEAHIESGTVVAPLETYLTDGKVRSTVFRYPNPDLAHKAAKIMFERASKQSAKGKNIPYDFGMVLEGKDPKGRPADAEIFCSEVAYLGYKLASEEKLLLPSYRTGLNMKNDTFLKSIGVVSTASKDTFAPSDMEVETRFELVAEWRNFRKTEKSRMTDAVLTQSYEYMEKYDYAFRNTMGDALKREIATSARRLGFLKGKVPDNMSRKGLGTMIALDKAAAPMLKKLTEANSAQKKDTGFAMTAPQMADFLDRLREEDYKKYLARKQYNEKTLSNSSGGSEESPGFADTGPVPPSSLYHDVFRPKKPKPSKH